MSNIPIFRASQVRDSNRSGMNILTANVQSEMDSIAASALRNEQQSIQMKLEQDLFEYKQLAYDSINQAYEKNPANPEGLQTSLNGARKSLMSGVPFALRQQADEWFFGTTQGYLAKSRSNETVVQTDQLKANTFKNLKNISNTINLSAENLFSQDASLNAQASVTLFDKLGEGIQSLNATLPNGSPIFSEVEKFKALEDIKESVLTTGMSRQFDKLETVEQKQAFLQLFKNNEIGIPFKDIQGNTEQIKVAEAMGFQGYDKSIRYMEQSISTQQKQEEKFVGLNYLQAVLQGDAQSDPARKDYTDAVNSFYEEAIRPQIQPLPPEEKATTMLSYISGTQVVPSMMLREVKAWNDSQDPKQLKTAAEFILAAEEQYPALLDKLSEKDFGKALAVKEKMIAGANADEVIRAVNQLYSPVTGEIFQQRSRDFTARVKDKGIDFEKKAAQAIAGFFQVGMFRPKFTTDTIMGPEAALQYKRIWQNQYELTNDWDKSEEIAKTQIRRLYGTSSVNNGQVMYLPPENFAYNIPGVDSKWMKDQLIEEGRAEIERLGLKIDPNTLFLYSDRQSMREADANGAPTYQVMGRNEAGNVVTINTLANEPMRWFPDSGRQRDIIQAENIANYFERADISGNTISSKINQVRTLVPFLFTLPKSEKIKQVYDNLNRTLTDLSEKSPIKFNRFKSMTFPSISQESIQKATDDFMRDIQIKNREREFN